MVGVRGHSKPDPAKVVASVRERLGWLPRPEVEPSPAEALPIDPLADIEATRAALKKLGESST